jgi:hypothetical protein
MRTSFDDLDEVDPAKIGIDPASRIRGLNQLVALPVPAELRHRLAFGV